MIKKFNCRICGKEFTKETRSYAFYCPECKKELLRKKALEYAYKKGRIKCPGVGSGGNQWGPNNHQWSNYNAEYSYRHLKTLDKCYMCGATKNLCRHHIDKNRSHNTDDNIVVLCRSCHAKVHNLINNITSRNKTSLIQGNSQRDNPEPSHKVEGATTNPDECKDVGSSESKCEATER